MLNESDKSISVTLRNNDPKLPLSGAELIEDAKGNKISSPLAVLPPACIDAMMNGQKVQGLPDINKLPVDRESVFYFNARNSPKSNKPNTPYQLQTRIKLFWRPKALENTSMKSPWQHKVTLIRNGQDFTVNNPTPYYVIISNASAKKGGNPPAGFTPLMMEPKTSAPLNAKMDSVPVLTYINDYGARMPLYFKCTGNNCQVDEEQSRKG